MSKGESFKDTAELHAWLKSKGVREDKAAEAAPILSGRGFDEAETLLGISSIQLEQQGLRTPLAQYLSNKLDYSPSKRTKTVEMKTFLEENVPKQFLGYGRLAERFGGLLDRKETVQQLNDGLMYLAAQRGRKNLDKKEVPVLGLTAPSESGKTEFLRWVFDNYCTYLPPPSSGIAKNILAAINKASPPDQKPLDNLLVLFGSFNQESTYLEGEGPIVETTVERLLRSYEGDISMGVGRDSWERQRFDGFSSFEDIMTYFLNLPDRGDTGFIFCVDELSSLRGKNEGEYRRLMEVLLQTSQNWLHRGGYCAVVASSLSIYDFGEIVLQTSGRCLKPIDFPRGKTEMTKKAEEIFRDGTDAAHGAESSKEDANFWFRVTTSALESSPSIMEWDAILNVPPTNTRVRPPTRYYAKPETISFDEIFRLVARAAFGAEKSELLTKEKLTAVVDKLHGSVTLDGYGVIHKLEGEFHGMLTLPPWRLLHFFVGRDHLFSWVQNWVVVETRKLFYEYGPSEARKTWELATMAVLELRKAMLVASADPGQGTPTLNDIINGLNVHHNTDKAILQAKSSHVAASNAYARFPRASAKCVDPCFYYSNVENEKGVEGVFRQGFETQDGTEISCFFQMKMYSEPTPKEISDWLLKADSSAKSMGFESGTYVLQLFVTGAIESNVERYVSNWPANSMVFATEALEGLYKPFGNGIINEIVDLRRRS